MNILYIIYFLIKYITLMIVNIVIKYQLILILSFFFFVTYLATNAITSDCIFYLNYT